MSIDVVMASNDQAIPALPAMVRAVPEKGLPALREKLGKPMGSLAEKQRALDP
jgi:hypothetical protein